MRFQKRFLQLVTLLLLLSAGESRASWISVTGAGAKYCLGSARVLSLAVPESNAYALHLDGVDEYGSATASSAFALGSAGTISVWAKWTPAMVNFQDLVSCFSSVGTFPGFSFWILDRKPSLFISDASFNIVTSTGAVLSDDTWYHLVVTWSGSTLKFYVNGVQHGTDLSISVGAGDSGVDLFVGADTNASPSRFFPGNLDEISIWNTSLDSTGIAALRSSGKAANLLAHPNVANGVAWWGMGDPPDSSGAISDRFGNGHTLTLHNTESGDIVGDIP